MKKNKHTNRKPLTLETETLIRLDRDVLGRVLGGNDEGEGADYAADVTEADHSCNVACHA